MGLRSHRTLQERPPFFDVVVGFMIFVDLIFLNKNINHLKAGLTVSQNNDSFVVDFQIIQTATILGPSYGGVIDNEGDAVFANHVGLNEHLQLAYLEHFRAQVNWIGRALRRQQCWPLPATNDVLLVVAFYCNAGEHRSVAISDLFGRACEAVRPGKVNDVIHACRSSWRWKYCRGCSDCQKPTEVRDQAVQMMLEMLPDRSA